MPISDIHPSQSAQEFQPLGEWAKRLAIPVKTLLHHASQGDLQLFTLPPFEVDYFSVNQDYIGNATALLPLEAQPISMPVQDVMGLILAGGDCAQLATGRKVEQRFFNAIIGKHVLWGNIVEPIPGRLGNNLRPDGWRIAAYKRITAAEDGEWNVH